MNLKEWQSELESVLVAVQKIETGFQSTQEQNKRQVCLAVNRLLQEEQRLDFTVQHFRSYQQTESFVSSASKSMIHWLHEIAENSLVLYRRTNLFLSRCTWLQCCYSLLTKDLKQSHWLLNSSQVLEMNKNYENLTRSSKVYSGRLQEIQTNKQILTAQYQSHNIERANIEASRSLQKEWGINPANAHRHPLLRELQILFHHINLHSHQTASNSPKFLALTQTFGDQSKGLMQQAKRMLEQNDRQSSPQVRRKTLKSLQAKLQEMTILEKRLDKLSLSLIEKAPSRVPIRVKKNPFQGRTVPTSHHLEHTS